MYFLKCPLIRSFVDRYVHKEILFKYMQRSDRNWFKLPEAGLKTCWTGVIYKNDKRESFKRRKVKYPVMPRSSILRSEFSHFCVPLYNIVYRWKIAWKKRRYDRASQEKCPTLTVFYVNHNRAVLWSGNERKLGIIRYDNKIRQHCCNLFCWPAKLGDQMLQPVSKLLAVRSNYKHSSGP